MSYSSLIQKDLPLISWALEDSSTIADATLAQDGYLVSNSNGKYLISLSSKSNPIVFGSSKSIIIQGTSGVAGIEVPSLDYLSKKTKRQHFSLEFWIKFISPTFSSPTEMKKIVGKPNSNTGVYIHNSSIVGVIGDVSGNTVKVVKPVDDITKTMHILLTYSENSVSLFVNGEPAESKILNDNVFSSYSSSNEKFQFFCLGTGYEYALDHISIYSRKVGIKEAFSHTVYGLGYEMPEQVPAKFGGTRYALNMAESLISGGVFKGDAETFRQNSEMKNLEINNNILCSKKIPLPKTKFSLDKSASVFSWGANGIRIAEGGYLEIDSISEIIPERNHGISLKLHKTSGNKLANGDSSTLIYLNTLNNEERYVRIYLEGTSDGEKIFAEVDGNSRKELYSVTNAEGVTGDFVCGYFYDGQNMKFFAGTSSSYTSNQQDLAQSFYFDGIRFGSTPVFSNLENYTGGDNRYLGEIVSISHTTSLPTTYESATSSTLINNYSARANPSEKRFVLSSESEYSFYVSLSTLSGINSVVGNNRIEIGSSSSEITIYGSIIGESEEELSNFSAITSLTSEPTDPEKIYKVRLDIVANDVVENPVSIYFARLFTYETEVVSSEYRTRISSSGPDLFVFSNSTNASLFPQRYDTPFLFNPERGGLYIAHYAKIDYDYFALNASELEGIKAVTMFVNIPSGSNRQILSVGGLTLSYVNSGTSLSITGGTVYLNGSLYTSGAIPTNQWIHLSVILTTQTATSAAVPITFGSSSATLGFYIDEIMVLCDSEVSASDIEEVVKIYKGTNVYQIPFASTDTIDILDSEISNASSSKIYQPANNEVRVYAPANFVASSIASSYTGSVTQILADGIVFKVGDRILVPTQGIYTITSIGSTIGKTGPENANYSMVYIKEGITNANKHYVKTDGNWIPAQVVPKVKSYSLPKTSNSIDVDR